MFKLIIYILSIVLLSACDLLENKVSHTAVSVDTNAYYSVYQKHQSDSWRVLTRNNVQGLETVTFTVEDSTAAFAVVFVCPSKRGDRPHEVHVYYSTKAEMERLNFFCRITLSDVTLKPVYGSVTGITMANMTDVNNNQSGEIARLAFSKDQSLDAWEAYATLVRAGTRDFVGIKGKPAGGDAILPETFVIRRQVLLADNTAAENINVDFSGVDGSYYNAPFDENSRSTVNIIGAKNDDVIDAKLGFLSRSQTLLNLVDSVSDSFTFLPVPLVAFTQINDEFYNSFEFNPGEGHELSITAKSVEGLVTREITKLFTLSNRVVHDVQLPQPVSNNPLLALKKEGDLQSLVINWKGYRDAGSGQTRLYRWVVQGQAAQYLEKKIPVNIVDEVKWHITVTPGWLNTVGAANDYTLVIPTNFDGGVSSAKGIQISDDWRKEWSFKENSGVEWEMSAIAVADSNKAEAVIEYLLNRKFDNNLQFSQVYVRSKTQP